MAATGYTEPRETELEAHSVHGSVGPAEPEPESLVRLGEAVLKVACKGAAVGAALHAGIKILSGINRGVALNK